MADRLSTSARSRVMRGVRSTNTRPELVVRRCLHRAGFRFRLHARDLPGRPDIVLPALRTVVDVRGCFWHSHTGCSNARIPTTRRRYWRAKLEGTQARDEANFAELNRTGWKVVVLWECELDGKRLSRTIRNLRRLRRA